MGQYFKPYTRIHSTLIKGQKVKTRTKQVLEENIDKFLHNLGTVNAFPEAIRKIAKFNLIQINFCMGTGGVKIQITRLEKTFTTFYHKGLISLIQRTLKNGKEKKQKL